MRPRVRALGQKPRPIIDETVQIIWPRFDQITEQEKALRKRIVRVVPAQRQLHGFEIDVVLGQRGEITVWCGGKGQSLQGEGVALLDFRRAPEPNKGPVRASASAGKVSRSSYRV